MMNTLYQVGQPAAMQGGAVRLGAIREYAGRSTWVSLAGAIDATGWSILSTFGSLTVTSGGKMQKPEWAHAIGAMIAQPASDGSAAAGGIPGVRLQDGVPKNNYFLAGCIAAQTTTGDSCLAGPAFFSPELPAIGDLAVYGTPGATDLGNADIDVSFRWEDRVLQPGGSLYWLAAEIVSSAATDLLSDAPVALGGDVNFPQNAVGPIRGFGVGLASDFAAAGDAIGQFRLQGPAIVDGPLDWSAMATMGEAAASSIDMREFPYIDEWHEVNPGSAMSWLAGYTGTDGGSPTLGAAVVQQV